MGRNWILVTLIFTMLACAPKKHEGVQLFFGECRLEVVSKTPKSEILVDGVAVGEGEVALEVPCGEKRIEVMRAGYQPFYKYFPLSKDAPIRVIVELEKTVPLKNEALSSELIEGIKPNIVAKAASTSAGGSAAAPSASEVEDSVENWR